MQLWRNWHTRMIQVHVSLTLVRVQVPPTARKRQPAWLSFFVLWDRTAAERKSAAYAASPWRRRILPLMRSTLRTGHREMSAAVSNGPPGRGRGAAAMPPREAEALSGGDGSRKTAGAYPAACLELSGSVRRRVFYPVRHGAPDDGSACREMGPHRFFYPFYDMSCHKENCLIMHIIQDILVKHEF